MGSYILYILTWSSEGIWETSILIYMAQGKGVNRDTTPFLAFPLALLCEDFGLPGDVLWPLMDFIYRAEPVPQGSFYFCSNSLSKGVLWARW